MKIKSILLIFVIIIAGCNTFHSRLFLLGEKGESVKGLYVFPTIVAYENGKDLKREYFSENDFWVELRVADTLTKFPGRLLDVSQDDPKLTELRGQFRQRVMAAMAVDSVIVAYVPKADSTDSTQIARTAEELPEVRNTLPAVIDVPGWKWQLIIRFGTVEIPPLVENLKIIVPYSQFDSTSNQFLHDTLTFSMHRYEAHQKLLWAEDIPNNFR